VGISFDKVGTGAGVAGVAATGAGTAIDAGAKKPIPPLKELEQAWQFAGSTAALAGTEGELAGDEMAAGAVKATKATLEQKAEVGLLGEATGIQLPRHVRGFVASLEGVGPLLSAAFSATAIYFLIEALILGASKLSEWVSKTFIFTESMRFVNDILLASNKALDEYNIKLKETERNFQQIGEGGAAKAFTSGLFKAEDAHKSQLELNDLANTLFFVKNGLRDVESGAAAAQSALQKLHPEIKFDKILLPDKESVVNALEAILVELRAKQKVSDQLIASDQREFTIQEEKEFEAQAQAQIVNSQKAGDAITTILVQQVLLRNAALKIAYGEDAIAKRQSEDSKYQIELKALEAEQALNDRRQQNEVNRLIEDRIVFEKDPTRNAKSIKEVDDQILAVEGEFTAKRIELSGQVVEVTLRHEQQELAIVADFTEQRRKILASALQTVTLPANDEVRRQLVINLQQELEIQRNFEDSKFKIEQTSLTQRATELAKDPERNVSALTTVYKEIESAELHHSDRMVQLVTDYVRRRDSLLAEPISIELPDKLESIFPNLTPLILQFGELLNAYNTLRVQGSGALVNQLEQEKEAYATLTRTGLATRNDLLQAEITQKQTEIELARVNGESTQKQEEDLRHLEDQWARITGAVRLNSRELDLWARNSRRDFNYTALAMTDMKVRGKEALDTVADAFKSAIQQFLLGQKSFGDAVRTALSQQLAAWSAEDAIAAIRAVALGFYKLAVHDYAAASNAFTAAAIYGSAAVAEGAAAYALAPKQSDSGTNTGISTQADTTESANRPEQAPVVVTNVPHLAEGALVSAPTRALIGESGTEAVLPLSDPAAMRAIVEALNTGEKGGDVFHITHNWRIDGVISADNLNRVIKQASRQVSTGRARSIASESIKVTKRS